MTAFDAAWAVLKGENIHPSARLHAEMGAAGMSMDPPQPRRKGGQLEPRDAFRRRAEQYQRGMQAAQDRARDGEGMPSGAERMPRDNLRGFGDRYAEIYDKYAYHRHTPDHKYRPMMNPFSEEDISRERALNYHTIQVQKIEDEYAAQGGDPNDFDELAFGIADKHITPDSPFGTAGAEWTSW
tara:strand:+ start:1272 stop:1820 length:549 start_codon:yes stop_codon:yes gene_type:complete